MTGLQTRQATTLNRIRLDNLYGQSDNLTAQLRTYYLNNPYMLTGNDVNQGYTYANGVTGSGLTPPPITAFADDKIVMRNSFLKVYLNNTSNAPVYVRVTKCRVRKNIPANTFTSMEDLINSNVQAKLQVAGTANQQSPGISATVDYTTGTVFRQYVKILSSKVKLMPPGMQLTATTKRNYAGRFATGMDAGNTGFLATTFTSFIMFHFWSAPTVTQSSVSVFNSVPGYTNFEVCAAVHCMLRYNLLEDNDPSTTVNYPSTFNSGPGRVMTEVVEQATDDVNDMM